MSKLPRPYYQQPNVIAAARDLLGKKMFTMIDGQLTGGVITETEAYAGIIDMGSHAYGGRRTARTETMYAAGGVAYVYLCYGIHALFNVVTGPADEPLAVLIRGIHPTDGIDEILIRRNHVRKNLADGPGKLTRALGITTRHNGTVLTGNTIWLEEHLHAPDEIVNQGPRIGIDYAGEDAKLPYRFWFDYNKLEKSLSEKK